MANIVLVGFATTIQPYHLRVTSIIESMGHTVSYIQDTVFTSDMAGDITITMVTTNDKIKDAIIDLQSSGKPLLIGGTYSGVPLPTSLGLSTNQTVIRYSYINKITPLVDSELYEGINYTLNNEVIIRNDNFAMAELYSGSGVGSGVGSDTGTSLNFTLIVSGSTVVFGYLVGQDTGYNTDGVRLIKNIINYLLNQVDVYIKTTDTQNNLIAAPVRVYNRLTGYLMRNVVSELPTGTVYVKLPLQTPVQILTMDETMSTTIDVLNPIKGETYTVVLGGGGVILPPDPTYTSIITGNVSILSEPVKVKLVAVSVEETPRVVGVAESDIITGDYSMDVAPWQDEVLIYRAADYGTAFPPDSALPVDYVIHPTVPNGFVYRVTTAGITGIVEPEWVTSGYLNSGTATLLTEILHRPIMNGYIKPIVTPI